MKQTKNKRKDKQEWNCTSVGMYDDTYKCNKCGEVDSESADDGYRKPVYGCKKAKQIMNITNYQRGIMEHTLSGPDRNWFGTDFKCKDSIGFEKLVENGLATKETPPT